jgi:lysozyme family protein
VATKIFDIAVNCGTWPAIRMAQRAACVPTDGVMGPQTIAAINGYDSVRYVEAISEEQRKHYRNIVKKDPSQEKFLLGWLNRAEWKGST